MKAAPPPSMAKPRRPGPLPVTAACPLLAADEVKQCLFHISLHHIPKRTILKGELSLPSY